MRKHIYILTALAIIVSFIMIACGSTTMSQFTEETGLIDEATGKFGLMPLSKRIR